MGLNRDRDVGLFTFTVPAILSSHTLWYSATPNTSLYSYPKLAVKPSPRHPCCNLERSERSKRGGRNYTAFHTLRSQLTLTVNTHAHTHYTEARRFALTATRLLSSDRLLSQSLVRLIFGTPRPAWEVQIQESSQDLPPWSHTFRLAVDGDVLLTPEETGRQQKL